MLVEVKVPQLSESVSEATLLAWHKKPGEYVQRDENLIDIETDKVVLELPAPQAGVLTKIVKGDGGTVVSNEVIATIDTEAKAPAAAKMVTAVPAPANKERKPEARSPGKGAAEPIALPAARKLAAENKVELSAVPGTGRGGRVTKEDVLAKLPIAPAQPAARSPTPAPVPTPSPVDVNQVLRDRPEQRVAMSRLRQRIAERLVQSQSSAAILTTFNEVNMQPVMELRRKYQERFEKDHGVRLGFMSFFVKAAVHALKKFPVVNASVDGSDIVYHGYFDVGIAVASPRGLVVPIIRDADLLSLAEIEKTIADFGKRAQDGKLGIEELTGGTFSISNGGVFGSMLSTPIINPPQSAILGIHATKERPVVENGQIVIRPMNYLALSYDHRIIDGREAVLSLVAIKDALEDPARMLLDL
ncbi:MAG TPA: 2-oxoglutarate dehydrogenase complex dihydrolipoyllysine-residue succinyltransferase [Burkholderiales bacterium]|nr:2-oxoglutarate dehydrogenase complex dihydrolipoyllysine-residue succinyltransferase [Burkholderiales bacterium]